MQNSSFDPTQINKSTDYCVIIIKHAQYLSLTAEYKGNMIIIRRKIIILFYRYLCYNHVTLIYQTLLTSENIKFIKIKIS